MRTRVVCAAVVAALTALVVPLTARADPPPAFRYERGFISSFDGTPIVWNLFLPTDASASHKVPVILRGHGWGGSGETATSASGTLLKLVAADYAVMTWDSRGFGQSGGDANVDDPAYEVRDASALVDLDRVRLPVSRRPLRGLHKLQLLEGAELPVDLAAADVPEVADHRLRHLGQAPARHRAAVKEPEQRGGLDDVVEPGQMAIEDDAGYLRNDGFMLTGMNLKEVGQHAGRRHPTLARLSR